MSLIPNRLCIYSVSDEEKEFIMIREEIEKRQLIAAVFFVAIQRFHR